MRQLIKNLANTISSPFPLDYLRKLSGENFIFPFYHAVSDKPLPHVKNLYHITPVNHFLNDLDFLMKHYRPALIDNVFTFVKEGKKSSEPFFFLTFDDGLSECFETVYPILKERGITAAFFINTAFVDNMDLFYKQKISLILEKIKEKGFIRELAGLLEIQGNSAHELINKVSQLNFSETPLINEAGKIAGIDFNHFLEKEKPYMSLEQIKELKENGFTIGSHSYNHPKFWEISEAEMKKQLQLSFNFLEEKINPEIKTFAFPFSDIEITDSFFRFLENEIKLDLSFGTAGIKRDSQINHLQRIPMDVELKPAKRILREEYAYFAFKSIFGKNTIKRR